MKHFKKLLFWILLLCLILLYGIYIEPYRYHVEEVSLNTQNCDLTIVQFSDTHLGYKFDLEQLSDIVALINEQNPDLVIFTGDLMDQASEYDKMDQLGEMLATIRASHGKYAVYGNHDYGGGAEKYYADIMKNGGFTLLVNQEDTLAINGKTIGIFGLDDLFFGKPAYSNVRAIYDYNILLVHEPDAVENIPSDSMPELILSGHSHGGQIRIPFYGPLIKTTFAEKYAEKEYRLSDDANCLLYVNTGLGTTTLPIRIGVPPCITVFKLSIS